MSGTQINKLQKKKAHFFFLFLGEYEMELIPTVVYKQTFEILMVNQIQCWSPITSKQDIFISCQTPTIFHLMSKFLKLHGV